MASHKFYSMLSDLRGNHRKKRPGIHAKTRASKLKRSKNYVKRYKGQGR